MNLIFYSKENKEDTFLEGAERYIKPSGYSFMLSSIKDDDTWRFYFNFLYPNTYQQQHIANRHLVETLEETGDTLVEPRKIEHWFYFNNFNMLKRFVKTIKKEGFSIETKGKINEEGYHVLSIARGDLVDLMSINELTDLLIELSVKFEGDYDGWETAVIKDRD